MLPQNKNVKKRTGDVAEWQNACLSRMRLWVQSIALGKNTIELQLGNILGYLKILANKIRSYWLQWKKL